MEEAYMEDAEFTTEQDINSIFIVQSSYMELNENLEDVSIKFNLPVELIKQIVKEDENTESGYLESLVRNLGNQPKTELIKRIEEIVSKRIL